MSGLEAPRSSTPPRRPARTAAVAQSPMSPAAGRRLLGSPPPSPLARGGAADPFFEPGDSKWGEVVTSLPLVVVSATDSSMNSEWRATFPSRPPGCETSLVEARNSDMAVAASTTSTQARGHRSAVSRRTCEFWKQHEQFALERSRELREAQALLDFQQVPAAVAAKPSHPPPFPAAAPLRGGLGHAPGPRAGSPPAASGRSGGGLSSRPAPLGSPSVPGTTCLDRLDFVRCEGETPPQAQPPHQCGSAPASSACWAAGATGTAAPLERFRRAASCGDVAGAASAGTRTAAAVGESRPPPLDLLRLPTPCFSEMTELLRQRLQEQGQQISQLRAELGSRVRVARALHASRGLAPAPAYGDTWR